MHPNRRSTDPRGGVVGWLVPGQPDRSIVAWWQDPGLWAGDRLGAGRAHVQHRRDR